MLFMKHHHLKKLMNLFLIAQEGHLHGDGLPRQEPGDTRRFEGGAELVRQGLPPP